MSKSVIFILLAITLTGCATQNTAPQIDRISEEELSRIMPQPVATLSLDEIVKLSKEGTPAEQIIERIKQTNSSYELSPSQSVLLNKQGVDNKVLDYIHESREKALRNNVADEINKREKEKRDVEKALEHNRRLSRNQFYGDPFFMPYWGFGYPRWGRPFYPGAGFFYGY